MDKLQRLAEKAAISSSYIDKTGQTHFTDDKVRQYFLNAMGIKTSTDKDMDMALDELNKARIIPDVLPFFDNEEIIVTPAAEGTVLLRLTDESGNEILQLTAAGNAPVALPRLPSGYYTLSAEHDGKITESLLIMAPKTCYQPEFIQNKEHLYGVSLMLYALRSEHSMGAGDFGDLAEIVRLTAENGGDAVGINPLGVMSPYILPSPVTGMLKGDVSPYRSLSRLFINYMYLNLPSEEDFKASKEISTLMRQPEMQAEIKRLNEATHVIYAAVLRLKLRLLELMYQTFLDQSGNERRKAFENWKKEKGSELYNLCLFETLLEKHPGKLFWRHWPDGTADITSTATKEFAHQHQERIDFYAYCHWLADGQLRSVQKLARNLGMKIGLYADMPIGAASNGAEVWENPQAYVLDAGIGAPADPMRPKGQSWGFTPYHPQELVKQHYAPFIRLVRENVSAAGALRIDHAMGLRRLFWGFFSNETPVLQGAYIYYDIKAMTAILSLESNRAKCLLIGEDLGTVPEGFREYMAEHGLLSYKVFFRQKEKDGTFIAPQNYMYMSLAQSSTHDQATSRGFWSNEDIHVFKSCGLYFNDAQYQDNLSGRRNDRLNMIKAFVNEKLLSPILREAMEKSADEGGQIPANLEDAVTAFGAKTNSALYLTRLCDIDGQQKLDNAPGTIDEYENWRLKLKHDIGEDCFAPAFARTMALIKKHRP